MTAFNTQTINYLENRADGGFAWNVSYDLSFLNATVQVALRVKLTGADPGQATRNIWENGVETIWNNKVFFADASRLYEVKVNLDFVQSGQHHTVTVHAGSGRYNMTNWYAEPEGWGPSYLDEAAAHESGHMLGNFDEYMGGATYNHYTTTGTLMSDLTVAGFEYYFWTVEYYAELYGTTTLSTTRANTGTADGDTLTGTSGMDGFYGLAGNDTISGLNGNDYIDGGSGNDTLFGDAGSDILTGGSGDDRFVFALGGGADTITDFIAGVSGDDRIVLTAFAGFRLTDILNRTTQVGADAVIDFGNGDTITVQNINSASLNRGDFVLSSNKAQSDFNANAKTDLLFVNNTSHGLAEWQIDGTQVSSAAQIGTVNAAAGWHYTDRADFGGDRKADLLFLNDSTHGIAIWQMDGMQVASAAQVGTINAAAGWAYSNIGDFDDDGKSDLLFLNDANHGVAVWQMNGTQIAAAAQVGTVNAAGGWAFSSVGDFDGDGKSDLLFLNDTTHGVAVWQMNGTQVASAAQVGTMDSGFHFADTGDFNGDGKTDLLLLNDTTHDVAVWQMNGTQATSAVTVGTINAAGGWHFADTGDYNGDGNTDLLFLNDTTHGVAVWQMNGTQIAAAAQVGTVNAAGGWSYSGAGDFNGDGKTDLLFESSTSHGIAVWEMNGTQILAAAQIGTVNAAADWHLIS